MRTWVCLSLLTLVLPVIARSQGHEVILTWKASVDTGVTYNMYRLQGACPASGTVGFTKFVTGITGTTYTDGGIAPGQYCYYATASLGGLESDPSNFAPANIAPGAPTSLKLTIK
jgi:hypothetical protein